MDIRKKIELYRAGRYVCEVPPVSHHGWDLHAWINWIDATGGWKTNEAIKRQAEREEKMIKDFYDAHQG